MINILIGHIDMITIRIILSPYLTEGSSDCKLEHFLKGRSASPSYPQRKGRIINHLSTRSFAGLIPSNVFSCSCTWLSMLPSDNNFVLDRYSKFWDIDIVKSGWSHMVNLNRAETSMVQGKSWHIQTVTVQHRMKMLQNLDSPFDGPIGSRCMLDTFMWL
jgi:hypothetical protein